MTGMWEMAPRSSGARPWTDVGFAPMVRRAVKLEKPSPKMTMPMPLTNWSIRSPRTMKA